MRPRPTANAGKRLALVFLLLLCTLSASAQSRNDQEAGVRGFFNSAAKMIYAAAWPSATYREWQLDNIRPVQGGLDVTLTISGQSGIDGSDLWVQLLVPFRNGSIGQPVVVQHNAFLFPPFRTTGIMLQLANNLASQYNAEHRTVYASPKPTPISPPDIKAAALGLLEQWRKTIVANDANSESALYAPVVASYYGRSQVSNAAVQTDKAAFIDRGYHVMQLRLDDVTFEELTPTTAHIQLVKNVTWQSPAGNITHKLLASHIDMQMYNGEWRITGERDGR